MKEGIGFVTRQTLARPASDRWSFKPVFMCLGGVTVVTTLCHLPGWISLLLIPLSLVGYFLFAITALAIGCYRFVRRKPRYGASALLVLLLPLALWRSIDWTADLIHLGLTSGFGICQLGAPTQSEDGRLTVYDWSVGLVTNPGTFLIRNATDEIASGRSGNKLQPNSKVEFFQQECAGNVEHLLGHYYVCSF